MAYELAEKAGLDRLIGDPQRRVGLKPNLVLASPAENGATTHPGLLEGLIRYLHERGYFNLCILEGSWVGARTREAFRLCGYEALSARTGVPLLDTQTDGARVLAIGDATGTIEMTGQTDELARFGEHMESCGSREMARTGDASSGTRGSASGKGASMSLSSARQAGHVFRCSSTAAQLAWEQAPS